MVAYGCGAPGSANLAAVVLGAKMLLEGILKPLVCST